MLSPRAKNTVLAFNLIALLCSFSSLSISQNSKENRTISGERGFLPIYNYSAKSYKAAPQNWAIQQDKRGVLYIGNNEGVLEYDGVSWRLINWLRGGRIVAKLVSSLGMKFSPS